jgi:hypothetical protein
MASQLEDKTIFIGNLRGKCPGSSVVQVAIYSLKLVIISIVTCGILLQFPLRSVCISVPTSNDVENATKVERLIMGQFVSSALFELSEFGALSSLTTYLYWRICAAAIIVTLCHSIRLRATGIRTASNLVSTLWKGSLLYALSLLGTPFRHLWSFPIFWLYFKQSPLQILLPFLYRYVVYIYSTGWSMNYWYRYQAD